MPTLNWIGKDKVINHHLDVPYRVLEKQYTFNADSGSENKIIHGDNLEALKSLLPEYEGRIKCIYIDPPYNTGNEGWVYNDNVNDPKIKKWLGEVVGKESEDLTRHDKWLCMMYPRLKLLHRLLATKGAIFISIDDNEFANLRLICDEIFGSRNFIEYFSWNKTETPANLSYKSKKALEYVICYQKEKDDTKFKGVKKSSKSSNGLMNQTNLAKEIIFPPNIIDTTLSDGIYEAKMYGTQKYSIQLNEDTEVKNGVFIKPVRLFGKFKWSQDKLDEEIKSGTKISIRTIAFSPSYERVEYDPEVPWNIIDKRVGVGTNENASADLLNIFTSKVFDYPKPPSLIEYLINFLCDKDDIILDSFAGSGTTSHAVLNLNQKDSGNRKFILVEMMDYANSLTAERVKRVIDGYGEGKNAIEGTGGDFTYYELGDPIFLDGEYLNEELPLKEIQRYIWYTETAKPFDESDKQHPHLLGINENTSYYFFYEKERLTTLNYDFLNTIKEKADTYVIYANNCVLPKEFLTKNNIIFKKIPRDITRF